MRNKDERERRRGERIFVLINHSSGRKTCEKQLFCNGYWRHGENEKKIKCILWPQWMVFLTIVELYVCKCHALTQTIAIRAFHSARTIRVTRNEIVVTIQPRSGSPLYHEHVVENILWGLRPFIDDDQIAHCVVL